MTKPKLYIVFRPVNGLWQSAEGVILADFLAEHGIVMDDRTRFARMNDYDACECIWYRAYDAQKITITIWNLDPR